MKKTRKRAISFLLTLALIMSVFSFVPSITSYAAQSPYTNVCSGDYTKGRGVSSENHGEFTGLGSIDNGDWAMYSGMKFTSGAKSLTFSYKKGTTSAATRVTMRVRIDSPTGQVISTASINSKNTNWQKVTVNCNSHGKALIGTHDVYLTFKVEKGIEENIGDTTPRLHLARFKFEKNSGTMTDSSMAKPTIKNITFSNYDSSGRSVYKVTWAKVSGASGYQVQGAKNSSFKSDVVSGTMTKTYAYYFSGDAKTTYIRIRAYKKAGNITVYGPWCTVKSFAPKKPKAVG